MTVLTVSFVLLFIIALARIHAEDLPHPLSDEFIDLINREQSSWKAGRNFAQDTPLDYIKGLMGLIKRSYDDEFAAVKTIHDPELIKQLPEHFDPRDKWPNCPSLNEIRDQGGCGSCWAFATVEAITDRYCIISNGNVHFRASAEDMLTCGEAGGCGGGDEHIAWKSWVKNGVVSGGAYNSNEGCLPYQIEPCEHHRNGKRKQCIFNSTTPECIKNCREGYNVSYEQDKRYGEEVHTFDGEDNIKAELYKNGPITVSFAVYEDFLCYKSSVYRHLKGKLVGFHAVKLMGWGVENSVKYWLVANSWNTDFGEKGFFKIIRGENHCDIERAPFSGEPKLSKELLWH